MQPYAFTLRPRRCALAPWGAVGRRANCGCAPTACTLPPRARCAQVLEKNKEPHKFEPYHQAMREPYDYYALGNDFANGVINREDSALVGLERIQAIQEQVAAGDNVVLLANHQSEADPQIFSVLLDPLFPGFAESTIFVAGDRVTTDLLAQPFSMGRNLLCIFSKKHGALSTRHPRTVHTPSTRRPRARCHPPHASHWLSMQCGVPAARAQWRTRRSSNPRRRATTAT